MRLYEITNEYSEDPEYLLEYIRNNCKQFLEESKGLPLYRGMRNRNAPEIFKSKIRNNREPLDTHVELQYLTDKIFKELGFTALRSNSIFCVGLKDEASNYGFPYYIFPLDGFTFTWSPIIHDFTGSYNIAWSNYTEDELKNELIKDKYTNENLFQAIQSNREIMISGKEYIAIKCSSTFGYTHIYNFYKTLHSI